jgi:CBS domain-containing protein
MVMLTELLGFVVLDEHGKKTRLADLCVALLEDDYPPVTHLLFPHEEEVRHLDWAEVTSIEPRRRRIKVTDLSHGTTIKDDKDVLLRRDVLDALVIDLLGRRTTRVSDLILEDKEGTLRIKGADAGLAAMVRRLTRGRFGHLDRDALFDWKYVEFLRGDPSAVDSGAGYRLRINRLPAGEIARLADLIPYLHAAELIKLLPDAKAADVLEAISVARQVQVIDELPEDEAIKLISLMSPDLATDLVGRLDVSMMKRFVTRMPAKVRERIIELLRYPEDSVGGVMINDMMYLSTDLSGSEANESIKERLKGTDFTSLVFVVDNEADRNLRGTVPLRDLLTMDEGSTLEQVMDPYVDSFDPFQPATAAAYRILDSGLPAMPVVDEGRLVGAMTVDAAIAQLVPATSELNTLRIFS